MVNATLFILPWLLQQAWIHNDPARLPNRPDKHVTAQNLSPVRTDSVRWIQVRVPGGIIRAAVATPTGTGPFPAVVILHGTHGFAEEYVHLARRLADNGMVGVAACWFAGRRGAGVRFITPIECPDTPPLADAPEADRFRISRQTIDSLLQAVRALHQVRTRQVVLFGHSRGAGAALDYALTHPDNVQGVVLNAGVYPDEFIQRTIATGNVPVLMLHGTADGPAEGGSAVTSVTMARRFEATRRAARQPVDAWYYEGSGHNGLFADSTQFNDTVHRLVGWVRTHMGK